MNREEAIRQIEEIQGVIQSTHKFALSGNLGLSYGVVILGIPLIERLTHALTFGADRARPQPFMFGLIHAAFYVTLFSLIRAAVEKFTGDGQRNLGHPILSRAMSYHRPFVAAIGAGIVIMMNAGLDQFVYPLVLLFFGVLLYIYGRLTGSVIRLFGWLTLGAGFCFGVMAKSSPTSLWIWQNNFLGAMIFAIGLGLRIQGSRE